MKDKKPIALIALLFAAVFIAGIIMFIGSRRDPFRNSSEHRIVTVSLEGQASVLRRGTGYGLKEGIGIIETDTLITDQDSGASFKAGDICSFAMGENTRAAVVKDEQEILCIGQEQGTVIYDTTLGKGEVELAVPSGSIVSESGAVFSLECYPGTQTLSVYRGEVKVPSGSETLILKTGERFTFVQNEDGKTESAEKDSIPIQGLSSFLLEKLASSEAQEAFTTEELSSEANRRVLEMERAAAEKAAYEAEVIARGGTVAVISSTKEISEYMTPDDIHSCTISIVCHTILNNMDDLTPDLGTFVPANGIILAPTTVQYVEGESVYDVLKRACSYANIPLRYSWTMKFGGYYIEGINNICEFDCGPQSGWMYKVNGWFPNYGSSNYILKDGDIIVWEYTCEGLGADIGCYWEL